MSRFARFIAFASHSVLHIVWLVIPWLRVKSECMILHFVTGA